MKIGDKRNTHRLRPSWPPCDLQTEVMHHVWLGAAESTKPSLIPKGIAKWWACQKPGQPSTRVSLLVSVRRLPRSWRCQREHCLHLFEPIITVSFETAESARQLDLQFAK